MHDLLEGVFPLELKAMLKVFCFESHFFTVKQLNQKLTNFDYGYTEVGDKCVEVIFAG